MKARAPLPLSVGIGPHTYEIRVDDETQRLLREENNNGDSRPDRLLVRIDLDRPHTAVAETLLHELMHCAWSITALKAPVLSEDDQEKVIQGLAPLLLDMLRGNPALVAFLTDAAT